MANSYDYSPFDLYDSVESVISYLAKNGVSLPEDKDGFNGEALTFSDDKLDVLAFPAEEYGGGYFDPEQMSSPEFIIQINPSDRYAGIQIAVNPPAESAEFYMFQSSPDSEWDLPSGNQPFFDNYLKLLRTIKAKPFKPAKFEFEN
jgi:hypothetical protein